MFKFLKSSQPFVILFIPLIAFALWINPLSIADNGKMQLLQGQMPLYELTVKLFYGNVFWSVFAAVIFLIVQAYLLLRTSLKFILIENRTYLPAVFFVILTGALSSQQYLHPIIFANFFVIFAIDELFDTYKKDIVFSNVFNACFYISLGSLFYINLIYYFLFILIGLGVIRPFRWRDWVVSFFGLLVPYILVGAIYFLADHIESLYTIINQNLFLSIKTYNFNWLHFTFFGISGALVLFSSFYFLGIYGTKKISMRKFFSVFFWLALFTAALFIIPNTASFELIYIFAIPISFMLTNYMINIRKNIFSEILFLLLIISVVLMKVAE